MSLDATPFYASPHPLSHTEMLETQKEQKCQVESNQKSTYDNRYPIIADFKNHHLNDENHMVYETHSQERKSIKSLNES